MNTRVSIEYNKIIRVSLCQRYQLLEVYASENIIESIDEILKEDNQIYINCLFRDSTERNHFARCISKNTNIVKKIYAQIKCW